MTPEEAKLLGLIDGVVPGKDMDMRTPPSVTKRLRDAGLVDDLTASYAGLGEMLPGQNRRFRSSTSCRARYLGGGAKPPKPRDSLTSFREPGREGDLPQVARSLSCLLIPMIGEPRFASPK
eukprot:gene18462-24944_t